MYKKIKRKKLYATGGFLQDNPEGVAMGATLVGDFLEQQGGAGSVFGGAAKGVAAGAALGPVGMVAGGALGLLGGVLNLGQQRKQERIAKQQKENKIATGNTNRSTTNLADFDTYGGTEDYYAMGGEIEGDPTKPTYTDSLNLYNRSKYLLGIDKKVGKSPNSVTTKEAEDYFKYASSGYRKPSDVAGKIKPVKLAKSSVGDNLRIPVYKKPTTIPNTIPNDLEWIDIEQPIQLNEVGITAKALPPRTYKFGKRGETMTQEEWDYSRTKRKLPDVYSDKARNSDNLIPGEVFSNQVRNDVNEFRNNKKLAMGGETPQSYEVEKGEVVQGNAVLEEGTQLSDDMHLVGGKSHENGGTEGIGGERVFSDRMKMNKEVVETLQKLGLPLKGQVTYAEAAKVIGKKKKIAEEKIDSKMAPSIKTGRRMMEDHDNALDIIFNIQEMMKPQTAVVKKYALGGPLIDKYTRPLGVTTNIPEVGGNFSYKTGLRSSTPTSPVIGEPNNWWEQNSGQLINAANFGLNSLAINKLDTTVKRDYMTTPRYGYKDRSSVARRNNLNAYKNTVDSLSSSSAGVTGSNAGALYASTLEANSNINNAENMRRDQYDENYSNKTSRVEAMNSGIAAEADDMSRDLTNNKRVALPTQARNAFLAGYAGNTAMSQRANLEKQKMIISAYMNNDRGVLSRISPQDIKNVQDLPIFKMFNQ
jgi:hypothetical protein